MITSSKDKSQAMIVRHRTTGEYAAIIVDNDNDMITHKTFTTSTGTCPPRHLIHALDAPESWLDSQGRQQWTIVCHETPCAEQEVLAVLEPNETIEAVVFGEPPYDEDAPNPIPASQLGIVLTWEEARPLMRGWQIRGGFGGRKSYAMSIYTNQRIGAVAHYDGSTWLHWIPRNPTPHLPECIGGG